jgi:ferric-dicitrate binding protein FerR (iron transport regulator)
VVTKNGSRTRILLPDGSSVWLNGSSKLTYDNKHFGDTLREVTLSGEGYFDVVKNPRIPFVIHTNNMQIKVLGTSFNVKAYPGEKNTETSLVRGSIEVTVKGTRKKIMMKANDKLIVPNEAVNAAGSPLQVNTRPIIADRAFSMQHLTFSRDDNSILETAWVDNKLVFDNETFEDVAVKMERWYGVVIRFKDDKLKNVHMTGTFEKQTVTEALQALQYLSPFTYNIKNDTITIAK